MAVYSDDFSFEMAKGTDIVDITSRILESVESSSVKNGIVCVFSPGSTGALTTIEYEPGLVHDLGNALERIIPEFLEYRHNERWHDGNGHSHVRASLIGQSISFPLINGEIPLGTWQQVICLNLDNRSRTRKVIVQVVGE
ncbi:secondary thiamine-phosphate synthase enzyme [Methanohalophilus levihalophilus]|uniref:secondary thiamine-phosphate synthase enzyme YjbQ n=1 Tax=Methanohalophilus levihalophilus TaxID=1431282 RepID=UPI001AE6E295|nr:secondary thiamine-phosphate synthase enzyme YjbQ [Methanohalophilus levihalophilus]MBP2030727.1 secondary thiamine-phosphate synthase enzyme [Methanohalophilus levihalophilus]